MIISLLAKETKKKTYFLESLLLSLIFIITIGLISGLNFLFLFSFLILILIFVGFAGFSHPQGAVRYIQPVLLWKTTFLGMKSMKIDISINNNLFEFNLISQKKVGTKTWNMLTSKNIMTIFTPFEFRIRIGEYIYDPKFNLIFNSISKYYLIMAIKDPQDILL